MNLFKLSICLLIIILATPASAKFYKYIDDEGNTRFTDDINLVPADQRKNIQSYEESISEPEETQASVNQEETQPARQSTTEIPTDSVTAVDSGTLEDQRKHLDALKKEIDSEYKELIETKKNLAKEREKAVSREEILQYNKKVENLNQRVKDYQQKGKDYEKQVEAYNERVAQENAALKSKQGEEN